MPGGGYEEVSNLMSDKNKMVAVHLPQYHASSLTQSIKQACLIACLIANGIMYSRFEDFRTFFSKFL